MNRVNKNMTPAKTDFNYYAFILRNFYLSYFIALFSPKQNNFANLYKNDKEASWLN